MGMHGKDVLIVENTEKSTNVADGNLTLKAYKDSEGYHVPWSVNTKKTMNYKYGYVEMRAKLSADIGSFASFWTRSASEGNALAPKVLDHYAAVDMFEVFNYAKRTDKNELAGNILKNFPGDSSRAWRGSSMTSAQRPNDPVDEEWHIFGYEWTPYEINLYIDGELYARFDITSSWVNGALEGKGKPGWSVNSTAAIELDSTGTGMESFHEAQYLIFNHHLHYTGAFAAGTSVTTNGSFSEADFVIDYCRVYQLDGQQLYTK